MNDKHMPKGSPKGGQFAPKDGGKADKTAEAVRKYSDTPEKDLAAMGLTKPSKIEDFVRRVQTGQVRPGEVCNLGEITDRTRKDIERLTGQKLNAKRHIIRADEVRHILKRHGDKGKADHSMAAADFAEIADVLSNYDTVEFGRNADGAVERSKTFRIGLTEFAPHLVYKMKSDKTTYVVEALTDTKKGDLHIVSAYKTKRKEI